MDGGSGQSARRAVGGRLDRERDANGAGSGKENAERAGGHRPRPRPTGVSRRSTSTLGWARLGWAPRFRSF